MSSFSQAQKAVLYIDALIFIFCVLGIFNITNKADLSLDLVNNQKKLLITSENHNLNLKQNDIIVSIEKTNVNSIEEVEIILDGKEINEKVDLYIKRDKKRFRTEIQLTNFYSTTYIAIACMVGLMFLFVALFVFTRCENRELALVTHWAFVFTAIIILMTWGSYTKLPLQLGFFTRLGFHVGYLFAPIYFLKFSLLFPSRPKFEYSKAIKILSFISLLLVTILSVVFVLIISQKSIEVIRLYVFVFDVSSLFIVLIILTALSIFIYNYSTSKIETERKKLRWILLGFILGPLDYLILWVIPFRLWNKPIIPEEIVLLLISFVPITFGIAIIKYNLFNVDVIFKRGIVYTTVISILLIIYSTILSIFASFLNNSDSKVASIVAAVSIALLFQPAKEKVQKFVDRKFFRIEYDYRLALNLFNRKIKDIHNSKLLLEKVLDLIMDLIPVSKLGFFAYDIESTKMELEEHINFNFLENSCVVINKLTLRKSINPITLSNNIEPGLNIIKQPFSELEEINKCLVLNMKSLKSMNYGCLVLGEKKSGNNFTAEDIDLLNIISSRVGLTLDRIKLQEEVIREHLETERLEELNKLKSFFVSSVSHDLKTPLTSIKLFAERLKDNKNISHQKQSEYLKIIEGESDRLTRLINNVLDYSKIEEGTHNYNFKKTNLIKVVGDVINNLEYQFNMNKFKVSVESQQNELIIYADEDAVSEALVNLLSNSIKFSRAIKVIVVKVYKNDNEAIIEVIDSGTGINNKDIENIFEPFFRSENTQYNKAGGAGLGLAIVKHIIDGHGGRIEVTSKLNEGSTFKLIFSI